MIIEANKVYIYRESKTRDAIINGISTVMNFNETPCIGIYGESGAGKTTFGKVLSGLIKPDKGFVKIEGKLISEVPTKQLRRTIQYVFQDSISQLYPNWKIYDLLLEGAILLRGENLSLYDKQIREFISIMFPDDLVLYKYPYMLSSGEAKRISIIRSLMIEPSILVLDEPTAGVDIINRKILHFILSDEIRYHVKGLVVISHDLDFIRSFCQRLIKFERGRIVADFLNNH